jgi:hypothetical protein
MKKILLALTFITQMAYAQDRIGWSYTQVTRDFASSYMTYYTIDTSLFLTLDLPYADVLFEFNTDSICFKTVVYPKTSDDLDFLITQCNSTCTPISLTSWIADCPGGFCKCELIESRYLIWTKL